MTRTTFLTRLTTRWLFLVPFGALLCNPSLGSAATAPSLNSAASFGVLAGSAVTCTNSVLTGAVGVVSSTGFTGTLCTSGTVHRGDSAATMAYADFLGAYIALQSALYPCAGAPLSGTLANVTLAPGIYCFTAAATLTGTLTLDARGDPNAVWIFKIGTGGTGALTATGFAVNMKNGGKPCNVYWWVNAAATLTASFFQGTILAGADITLTGTTFNGDLFAGGAGTTLAPTGAVSSTGSTASSCRGGSIVVPPGNNKCEQPNEKDKDHQDNDHKDNDHKDNDHKDNDHKDNDWKDNDWKDKNYFSKDGKRW
jgi:hypothetical protein